MTYKVIRPRTTTKSTESMARYVKRERPLCSDNEDSDVAPRKQYRRVSKACERCRLKKTKCDGEIPCRRCTDDMVACCEGAKRKGGPKTVAESCVELLEFQQTKLIAGHIKMYRMMVDAGIWTFGDVKKNSRGIPIVHDILEKLGVMRSGTELPNGFPESPDENRTVRLQLEAAHNRRLMDNEINDFKQTTVESSAPSLVDTDRESSIETCFSEVKPTVEKNSNSSAARQVMGFSSEFQLELNASSWRNQNLFDSRRFDSITIPSHRPIASTVSKLYDDHLSSRQKPLLSLNLWAGNGLDANQSYIISNIPTQPIPSIPSIPHYPIEGQDNYEILLNSRASSTNDEDLEYMQSLQYIDVNRELMPLGMKYGYDPFMG